MNVADAAQEAVRQMTVEASGVDPDTAARLGFGPVHPATYDPEGRRLVQAILDRKAASRRFTDAELHMEWVRLSVSAGLHGLHKYGTQTDTVHRFLNNPSIHEETQ